jgi:hypothetical protein
MRRGDAKHRRAARKEQPPRHKRVRGLSPRTFTREAAKRTPRESAAHAREWLRRVNEVVA